MQLNWGDAGLEKLFKTVHRSLAPGGLFLVEPQPWKSYRQAFRKQAMPEETHRHFKVSQGGQRSSKGGALAGIQTLINQSYRTEPNSDLSL